MNCQYGYWSNLKSTFNTATEPNDQRCTYNTCKNWDYENVDDVGENLPDFCSTCWDKNDMIIYNNWDGRGTFTKQEVQGRHQEVPFKRQLSGPKKGQCELQCKDGYWSNYASDYNTAIEPNDQRCTYNNCKNWDYFDTTTSPEITAKSCHLCWNESDMLNVNYIAALSYRPNKVLSRNRIEPFMLNSELGVCKLQCKIDYYSNYDKNLDPNEQFCTNNNCKTWNSSGLNENDRDENCVTCWQKSDLENYDTWPASSNYRKSSIQGRNTNEPFIHSASDNTCFLQCDTSEYWLNFSNDFINPNMIVPDRAQNALDTRCTHYNCKSWNYYESFWTSVHGRLREMLDTGLILSADFDASSLLEFNGKAIYGSNEKTEVDHFESFQVNSKEMEIILKGKYTKTVKENDISYEQFSLEFSNTSLSYAH